LQKLNVFECGKWQNCPFCHDFGIFGGQKIWLILNFFCKIIKFSEGLKFWNLKFFSIIIKKIPRNNRSDPNFNQKFDYEFGMQGLSFWQHCWLGTIDLGSSLRPHKEGQRTIMFEIKVGKEVFLSERQSYKINFVVM